MCEEHSGVKVCDFVMVHGRIDLYAGCPQIIIGWSGTQNGDVLTQTDIHDPLNAPDAPEDPWWCPNLP